MRSPDTLSSPIISLSEEADFTDQTNTGEILEDIRLPIIDTPLMLGRTNSRTNPCEDRNMSGLPLVNISMVDQNDIILNSNNKVCTLASTTFPPCRAAVDKLPNLPATCTAWNPKIDWSRSTVDLSSDEESVPNSVSSADLSDMDGFDEDVFGATTPQNRSSDDFWHDDAIDSNLCRSRLQDPPFRRRASTTDGLFNDTSTDISMNSFQQHNPRYRGLSDSAIAEHRPLHCEHDAGSSATPFANQHLLQIPSRTRSRSDGQSCQSKSSSPSSSFTNVFKSLHVRQQRIPLASKGLMFLFLIAAYTTLFLQYSDVSGELQKIIDKRGDITDDMPSMTSSSLVTAVVVKDSSDHILGRRFEVHSSPNQGLQQQEHSENGVADIHTGHAVSNVFYARKKSKLKRFLRREEVANFLQQKTIVQQQSSFIRQLHVHVVILAVVVIWAFLIDYVRIRRIRNTTVCPSRLDLSPEIV